MQVGALWCWCVQLSWCTWQEHRCGGSKNSSEDYILGIWVAGYQGGHVRRVLRGALRPVALHRDPYHAGGAIMAKYGPSSWCSKVCILQVCPDHLINIQSAWYLVPTPQYHREVASLHMWVLYRYCEDMWSNMAKYGVPRVSYQVL